MDQGRPPATRMNLMMFKERLKAAKKGYDLLKKKRDALRQKLNQCMKTLVSTKKKIGNDFNEVMLAYAEANFAAGDFSRSLGDIVKARTNI